MRQNHSPMFAPPSFGRPKYPIVETRQLQPKTRRSRLGLLPPARKRNELPNPQEPYHALVYLSDGRYVLDNMSHGDREEYILRASNVTVVNMQRMVSIDVRLDVPSADKSTFRVTVTFGCTVVDAVQVVRSGIVDPGAILLAYVKQHHNATQMGLHHRLSEINDVREYIAAQLTAYATMNPPVIDGMEVTMISVEVLTPDEVASYESLRRQYQRELDLAAERLLLEHQRTTLEYEKDLAAQHTKQWLASDQGEYERMKAMEEQRHHAEVLAAEQTQDLARRRQLGHFQREEFTETAEVVKADADNALLLGLATGQLTPTELADRLRNEQERQRVSALAETDKDRAERRLDLEAIWAERQAELAAGREERRWDREESRQQNAVNLRQAELERQWQRDDAVASAQAARDAEQRRLEANLQLLRELAQRGHFDSVNVDLERLVSQLSGPTAMAGGETDPALESADDPVLENPALESEADPALESSERHDER